MVFVLLALGGFTAGGFYLPLKKVKNGSWDANEALSHSKKI